MFKLYKKADILEKISDKVKTVDDLLNLPLSEFDRVLSNNGVKRVFGSDLKFVRHTEPEKGEQK